MSATPLQLPAPGALKTSGWAQKLNIAITAIRDKADALDGSSSNEANNESAREFIRDTIAAALQGVGTVTTVPDDPANKIYIQINAIDIEGIEDAVAGMFDQAHGTGVTVTYNDGPATGGGGKLKIEAVGTGGGTGGSFDSAAAWTQLKAAIKRGTNVDSIVVDDSLKTLTINIPTGAGLTIGTGATNAKAGNYTPSRSDLPDGTLSIVYVTTANPNPSLAAYPLTKPVLMVGGTVMPTTLRDGDVWLSESAASSGGGTTTPADPMATIMVSANAEGLADLAAITTSNSPYTAVNTGGGSNTNTATKTNPLRGLVSYKTLQATGGAINTLGFTVPTALTQWTVGHYFRFDGALPALTGGAATLKLYTDDAFTGTLSGLTVFITSTGRCFIRPGLGASAGTVLDSAGAWTVLPDVNYLLQVEGNSSTNKLRAKVIRLSDGTIVWQTAWATPDAGWEVQVTKSGRGGLGTASSNTTMVQELDIAAGPGWIV